MNNAVIIVAGGQGLRMGDTTPKQFLPLCGKPVLIHTLEAFHRWDASLQLVTVVPKGWTTRWKQMCTDHKCKITHRVVEGGDTRFQSVRNALMHVLPCELIAVHDGVRPLVPDTLLNYCFSQAQLKGSAIPAVRVTDSLRYAKTKRSRAVDRNYYYAVQTPQIFRYKWLIEGYMHRYNPAFTDDASVVESARRLMNIVPGDSINIKITTPIDLLIAEQILTARKNSKTK
jgi:2-C-methyl-D-erythritol 4-phosphate cytidylyltransferase